MIIWLTCTYGRYKCLQRNLRCYLDQDFTGPSVMFICNSGEPLKLPDGFQLPPGKEVYIDNCKLMNFTSVGEKYKHALSLALRLYPDAKIVTSADDDDIFLPNHLTEGYKGYTQAVEQNRQAYKPKFSYFRYRDSLGYVKHKLQQNVFEPSIFVSVISLLRYGYAPVSIRYHQQWLDPLVEADKIWVAPHGTPTLIYNWGDNWDIYKLSGAGQDTSENFVAHASVSTDMGNGILVPNVTNEGYYKLNGLIND